MNLPTTSSLNHPELEEDEIFLLNIAPEEFERFNTSRPKWAKSLRMGKIAIQKAVARGKEEKAKEIRNVLGI